MPTRRLANRLAAISAVAFVIACGSNSPTTPPAATPTPAPVMTLLSQGSSSNLPSLTFHWVSFTTVSTGRIDVTVDWTFATDTVWLVVAPGTETCYDGQRLNLSICNVIVSLDDATKPKKLSLPGQPAGTYTLYIRNRGPNTEAISWQVFVTTPG